MHRKIFVNLPIKDLPRTKAFWETLGFPFNKQFTGEQAACMVLGPDAYVMLLTEPHFLSFVERKICDTSTHVEALVAISAESRAEVDELLAKALRAGAKEGGKPQDHGFMYGRAFDDLDGHRWEVIWMDPKHVQ